MPLVSNLGRVPLVDGRTVRILGWGLPEVVVKGDRWNDGMCPVWAAVIGPLGPGERWKTEKVVCTCFL
ncbi:hypothetical protein DPMN_036883 [Dreissena polymorpha]|uniref:Uncharacterized protein n=1 Tax=Dreissena polymorpha TaxID=45954 RepID=A0A9D4RLV3_DREPO|nr:hypothetical protein DPMN_036883 [Dreissena polymorpha]